MILDKLSNSHLYYGLGERFKKGFEYLKNTDISQLAPGKYELDGDNLKVAVQEYETKDASECKIEAHKRYADIQFIFSGNEQMGIAPYNGQDSLAGYNDEKDVWHFANYDYIIKVPAGSFTVFFPEDIHMPGAKSGEKSMVKKVVVKVLL